MAMIVDLIYKSGARELIRVADDEEADLILKRAKAHRRVRSATKFIGKGTIEGAIGYFESALSQGETMTANRSLAAVEADVQKLAARVNIKSNSADIIAPERLAALKAGAGNQADADNVWVAKAGTTTAQEALERIQLDRLQKAAENLGGYQAAVQERNDRGPSDEFEKRAMAINIEEAFKAAAGAKDDESADSSQDEDAMDDEDEEARALAAAVRAYATARAKSKSRAAARADAKAKDDEDQDEDENEEEDARSRARAKAAAAVDFITSRVLAKLNKAAGSQPGPGDDGSNHARGSMAHEMSFGSTLYPAPSGSKGDDGFNSGQGIMQKMKADGLGTMGREAQGANYMGDNGADRNLPAGTAVGQRIAGGQAQNIYALKVPLNPRTIGSKNTDKKLGQSANQNLRIADGFGPSGDQHGDAVVRRVDDRKRGRGPGA